MLDERRLRRVLEVGRAVVSEPELEALLPRVLDEACELTGARYAALGILDGHVELTVHDDGRGFDPAADTDGFGLLGMRERVLLVDGRLAVEAAPGAGTTVRATLPVPRPAEQDDAAAR